jgi:xanthine dehydrogenase accessory factor
VIVSSPTTVYETLRDEIRAERPVALATLISHVDATVALGAKLLVRPGHEPLGSLGDADLDRVVARDAAAELSAGLTSTRHYGTHGEARREDGVAIFIESFSPPPRMIIFGAVDFTAALVRAAKLLGYNVVVCDARPVFATKQRFPLADDVVNDWPDRFLAANGANLGPLDAICVLTHDPKFDVPAIVAAVKTGVGYLGAMGSRRTTIERADRLREVGLVDAEIARVMGPIGLDIGSRTPEETAISIVAEIIALRTGRATRGALASLRDLDGPIHVRS